MRRISRRSLLTGTAATIATGTGALVIALRERDTGRGVPPPRDAAFASPAPSPVPSPTADTRPRGGIARLSAAASLSFDTFDALRAGKPAVVEILGRTHSRLLQWKDFANLELGPDLAASWERPDDLTLVLHLDPAARWHDRPPVNGRAVAANDVVQHLRRSLALAETAKLPMLQRAEDLVSVSSVQSPEANTVVITTSRPDPLLLPALANRFALVQAPEAVAAFEARWQEFDPATVIGSGPFIYDGRANDGYHFSAHRTGHRLPLLDGIVLAPPGEADLERFHAGTLDEVLTRDRREAPALRADGAGYTELACFEDSPVISTFAAGAPPWNNPELVRAISGALNRPELARRLFAGRAVPAGPVAPVFGAFALPQSELAAYPGYRPDFSADAAEARARWEAAGGPALGVVTIDFPSVFDPRFSASSIVTGMLAEVLGSAFHPAVETYTTISTKVATGRYGNGTAAFWFGWGPPFASPDPMAGFLAAYGTLAMDLPALGGVLSALDATFDAGERVNLLHEASRIVLKAGSPGVVPWLVERAEVFRWPHYTAAQPSPFGTQHLDAEAAIDTGLDSYSPRR